MKKIYFLFFCFILCFLICLFSATAVRVFASDSISSSYDWNLFEPNFADGEIGKSGVTIIKNLDGTMHVSGVAKETSVKNIGDITLDAGEYIFKGLSNQEKSSIALQLWRLDEQKKIIETLVPEIGYYGASSFSIGVESSVRVRIIVYQNASVDVTFIPVIEEKKDNLISYSLGKSISNGVCFQTLSDNLISINGTSNKTFIKQIADIQLNPGEYTLKGLRGAPKNTIALQLWFLDENNNPISLVCAHVGGECSQATFTLDETSKLRLRFIVYGGSDISICSEPIIICDLKYPRIEGNLIDFINLKGEIGKTGVSLRVQKETLNITGMSSTIGVRAFGTTTLYPGTYLYSGLDGMEKNSIALQLWEIDENGKEVKTICPQIGTKERSEIQFTITKKTDALCRVIVYENTTTNISCNPCITLVNISKCDFQSINNIDNKVNVLVMEEGYQRYAIYRSNDDKQNFEKVGSQKESIFYDADISINQNYSYYYVADGVIESEIREQNFNFRNCTRVACLMYHYFMTDDDLNNGGLANSYVYVDEFEEDLKYLTSHNIETIFCSDLIAFLKGEIELPERCVMIVIDDGHYSIYKYVLPLLEKYKCKANATIIGQFADRSAYRTEIPQSNYWLTWEEIGELSESEYFEIGSHTYYLHNITDRVGAHKKSDETDDEYHEVLKSDGILINEKLLEVTENQCYFFAYPYNNPSLIGVDYMCNDFGYQLFFVGDSNYWNYTKTRCNYFVQGTYESGSWWLIRRAGRRTGEDFETFLNDIYANQNSQY